MADELPLDGEGVRESESLPEKKRARGFYKRRQEDYCEVYGSSLKTIKNWISEGKDAGNLPPLDVPAEMPGWWVLVHPKRSVPSRILAAASEAPRVVVAAALPATLPLVAAVEPRAATGYAASLDRLRRAEAEAFEAYERAKVAVGEDGKVNEAAIEQARRVWSETSDDLRKQEAQSAQILERSGELLPAGTVRQRLAELHGPIVAGLRSLYGRIRTKAGNVTLDQAKPHFDEEISRMMRDLVSSEFAPANA